MDDSPEKLCTTLMHNLRLNCMLQAVGKYYKMYMKSNRNSHLIGIPMVSDT